MFRGSFLKMYHLQIHWLDEGGSKENDYITTSSTSLSLSRLSFFSFLPFFSLFQTCLALIVLSSFSIFFPVCQNLRDTWAGDERGAGGPRIHSYSYPRRDTSCNSWVSRPFKGRVRDIQGPRSLCWQSLWQLSYLLLTFLYGYLRNIDETNVVVCRDYILHQL